MILPESPAVPDHECRVDLVEGLTPEEAPEKRQLREGADATHKFRQPPRHEKARAKGGPANLERVAQPLDAKVLALRREESALAVIKAGARRVRDPPPFGSRKLLTVSDLSAMLPTDLKT